MKALPPAKQHRELNLVVVEQEASRPVYFDPAIVRVGLGPDADLFQVNFVRVLLFGLLFLLILPFAVVHDPADGRPFRGCHLHEVFADVGCHSESLVSRDNPDLFVFIADDAHRRNPNLIVNTKV